MQDKILQHLGNSIETLQQLKDTIYTDMIKDSIKAIEFSLRNDGKILLFGNGGSAADAQHIAAELIGRYKKERAAIPAIALTTDSSILTAWSNDYEYETIFARQIEGLGQDGDIAFGITTSGNSANVIEGFKKAKEEGLTTILLGGCDGGKAKALADYSIIVPQDDVALIQQAHMVIYHLICEEIERGVA